MTGGYIFSLSTIVGGGGVPQQGPDGGRHPSQFQMGGYPGQVQMGGTPARDGVSPPVWTWT